MLMLQQCTLKLNPQPASQFIAGAASMMACETTSTQSVFLSILFTGRLFSWKAAAPTTWEYPWQTKQTFYWFISLSTFLWVWSDPSLKGFVGCAHGQKQKHKHCTAHALGKTRSEHTGTQSHKDKHGYSWELPHTVGAHKAPCSCSA